VIYIDWNATAPLRTCARDAWLQAQATAWGNPASVHRAGQQARAALDAALASCAVSLGCHADELVVTSGGSEALATVLRGVPGPAVVSAIDHSAVRRNASDPRIVAVDGGGRIDAAALAAAAPGAGVVAIQAANNEVGTLQDVPALAAAVRRAEPRAIILVDACQLAGKTGLRLSELGADAVAIAGHKLGAPKGIGLLWLRRGVRLPALIHGGRQQSDRRSGTEDAALAAACAAALAEATAEAAQEGPRQAALIAALWDRLSATLPRLRRLGDPDHCLPNTLGLVHPGLDGRHLAMRLDLAGIAVSTGAACLAGRGEPSHVARALCGDDALARSFVRLSIGRKTTAEDLACAGSALVEGVRAMAGAGAVAG
jgi:cysteine desulfurase